MADFNKYTNYKDNAGISSVVFGANSTVLEVELNEMQEIQKTMLRRTLKSVFGDGITDISKIKYENGTFRIDDDCTILADGYTIKCTGLELDVTAGIGDTNIYLHVWEDITDFTQTLKEEGNQQSTVTVDNYFKDTRGAVETTKRKVLKYTLSTTINPDLYSMPIGILHSNGSITKLIKEVNYGRLCDKVIGLQVHTGIYEKGIIGVEVDLENNIVTRVGDNEFWSAGDDYTNGSTIYGNRKRCIFDGANSLKFYDPTTNTYDGVRESNTLTYELQFMVYQPVFYYKRIPIRLVRQENGNGYHMTKWVDLISSTPREGFTIHPAFVTNGVESDHYLIAENNGNVCWSEPGQTPADGACEHDFDDLGKIEDYPDYTVPVFSSIPGAKPASGTNMTLNLSTLRTMCKNRGAGWCPEDIGIASAEQMLFLIEYATFNVQSTELGNGVTSMPFTGLNDSVPNPLNNTLGNGSGVISTQYMHSNNTNYTVDVPVYRGVKNPFGNIHTFIDGIMLDNSALYWSNSTLDKIETDKKSCGFTYSEDFGYISAFGYSDECDFTYIPTKIDGDSNKPVGDIVNIESGDNHMALCGYWNSNTAAGMFYTLFYAGSDIYTGGRLCWKSGHKTN